MIRGVIKAGVIFLLLSNSFPIWAQPSFNKGVNLTNWFQSSSPREIQFTKFTRKDLERIKSLGCDVIRLPINLHAMTAGEPDHILDPLFFTFLDQVVTWAEELEIHLILDNHTFDPAIPTSPDVETILVKVWTQMADHYKNRSGYILYEVLNEPHGISDIAWIDIQQTVIDAIRTKDSDHFIIVGAANWNSYQNLDELPVYSDPKLIYTFHFYDPFIFTHQGASWIDPSMVALQGVPFPYDAADMPATPPSLTGTWVEDAIDNYSMEGTVSKVKSLIDIAVNFRNTRNVPVFCGELGVIMTNCDNADRVFWYETVRKHLEENDIAWTTWDYTGIIGLFEKGSNELFDHDLNVSLLEALGMNIPPQQPYVKTPATKAFTIYDDFIGENIIDASYSTNGTRDFYDKTSPKNGEYSIYWTGAEQYGTIGFDFKLDPDLSLLASYDHSIKLWIRTNSSDMKVDIRFVDTKTGENDHPWRMGKTIEGITGDMTWQLIEVLLTDLEEKGSWDNAFYSPVGKFDWTSVDRFEIVSEHHDMDGVELWFDNIHIFGEDIPEAQPVTSTQPETLGDDFTITPNPVMDEAIINFFIEKSGPVQISGYTITGREFNIVKIPFLSAGHHKVFWNGMKDGLALVPGLYLIKIEGRDQRRIKKILKKE